MYRANIALLAILPFALWLSIFYVVRSTDKIATKLRTTWGATTVGELIEQSRVWAIYGVLIFVVVLAGVYAWVRLAPSDALATLLGAPEKPDAFFRGIILGLGLLGLMVILRKHFPEARKFRFLIMTTIASGPPTQIAVLGFIALAEEIWRAVSLVTLTAHSYSGPQALAIVAIVSTAAYLPWGVGIAVSDGILAAAFGGLFLWSGSVFVPVAARIVLGCHSLLCVALAPPKTRAGEIFRRRFTKCPVCGGALGISQVKMNVNESFLCPLCGARITSSDERRLFVRWGTLLVSVPIMFGCFDVFPGAVHSNTGQYWAALGLMMIASNGVFAIVVLLVPPKLVCGDADFLRLNLSDHESARRSDQKLGENVQPDNVEGKSGGAPHEAGSNST